MVYTRTTMDKVTDIPECRARANTLPKDDLSRKLRQGRAELARAARNNNKANLELSSSGDNISMNQNRGSCNVTIVCSDGEDHFIDGDKTVSSKNSRSKKSFVGNASTSSVDSPHNSRRKNRNSAKSISSNTQSSVNCQSPTAPTSRQRHASSPHRYSESRSSSSTPEFCKTSVTGLDRSSPTTSRLGVVSKTSVMDTLQLPGLASSRAKFGSSTESLQSHTSSEGTVLDYLDDCVRTMSNEALHVVELGREPLPKGSRTYEIVLHGLPPSDRSASVQRSSGVEHCLFPRIERLRADSRRLSHSAPNSPAVGRRVHFNAAT